MMSNENQLLILQKGVEIWNKWRQDNPDIRPILFMPLSDGSSLIIGCSLNDVSKDEKAHIEFDREDQDFFDSMWRSAQRMDERSS